MKTNTQCDSCGRVTRKNWGNAKLGIFKCSECYRKSKHSMPRIIVPKFFMFLLLGMFLISFGSATDITSCQNINSAGVYNLINNISLTTGPIPICIKPTVSNVVIDCNGYWIGLDGGSGHYGIGATATSFLNNITIRNCNFFLNTTGAGRGISLNRVNNTLVENNNFYSLDGQAIAVFDGVFFEYIYNSTIRNNSIYNAHGNNDNSNAFMISDIYNVNFENNFINSTSDVAGIIEDAFNVTFKNVRMTSTGSNSIKFGISRNVTATFINSTVSGNGTFVFSGVSNYTNNWWTSINVKNSTGSNLEGATLTYGLYNGSSYADTTDSNGNVATTYLPEYFQNSTGVYYLTPTWINTTKSYYISNNTLYNLSVINNLNINVNLTGGLQAPTIVVITPTSQNYNSTNMTFTINASSDANISRAWYSLDGGTLRFLNNYTNNITFTESNLSMTEGGHSIIFYANDTLGTTTTTGTILFNIHRGDITNGTVYYNLTDGSTTSWNENANLTFTSNSALTNFFSWFVDGIEKLAGIGQNVFNYVFNNTVSSPNSIVGLNTYVGYTGLCYQESANTTNQTGIDGNCGLNYTGEYVANSQWTSSGSSKIYDGNWSTFSDIDGSTLAEINITYNKPLYVTSALWLVKDGSSSGTRNISVLSACLQEQNLTFKILSMYSNTGGNLCTGGQRCAGYYCLSSGSWRMLQIGPSSTTTTFNDIYEEAVYWNISSPLSSNETFNINTNSQNPNLQIIYPANGVTYTQDAPITQMNYSFSDATASVCKYSLNGGANQTITCGTNVTGLTIPVGSNTIQLYATDNVTNTNVSTTTFTYKKLAYNASNVIYQCGEINTAGTYTVNQSIAGTNCLNVTYRGSGGMPNIYQPISINGNGFNITYNSGNAIKSQNLKYFNLTNLNIINTGSGDSAISAYLALQYIGLNNITINSSNKPIFEGNFISGTINNSNFISDYVFNMTSEIGNMDVILSNSNFSGIYNISVAEISILENNLFSKGINLTLRYSDSLVNLIYKNSYGNITWGLIGEENIYENDLIWLGSSIIIGNNTAYVNSTALTGLNIPANITLAKPTTTYINPRIMKDNLPCTTCTSYTSNLNNPLVTFGVTGFSNYTIGDIPNITIFNPTSLLDYGYNGINMTLNYSISSTNELEYSYYNQTSSSICYQETATSSTACGGLATGAYSNISDYFYINYTIPIDAKGAIWKVKQGNLTSPMNYTLIIPDSCFNISNKLVLRMRGLVRNFSTSECSNGTNWLVLNNLSQYYPYGISGDVASSVGRLYDGNWGTNLGMVTTAWWEVDVLGSLPEAEGILYEEGIYWGINATFLNATSNLQYFTYSNPNKDLTISVNDIYGNTANANTNWSWIIYQNNVTYSPTAVSGSLQQFKINLTYDSSFTGITTYLYYNGDSYIMSSADSGYTKEYIYTLNAPTVSSVENKTFHFNIALSNSSGTYYFNSSFYNQTVSAFIVDNCSTYNITLLNMSMVDEETLQSINGTILFSGSIYTAGHGVLVSTYNNTFNYNGTPVKICVNSLASEYSFDYVIQHYGSQATTNPPVISTSNTSGNTTYSSTTSTSQTGQAVYPYFKKFRTIQNMTLNNNTIGANITLYNLIQGTGGYTFLVRVTGNYLSSNSNNDLLVQAQKRYLSSNDFKLVESAETNSDGEMSLHLVPSTEVYNFIVSYYGQVLGTFNNYQVKCENAATGQCEVTLNLVQSTADLPDFSNTGQISWVYLYDNTTRDLYLTFTSTDGSAHTVNNIVRRSNTNNTIICNNTGYGTSGSLTCNIPTFYTGNGSIFSNLVVDDTYKATSSFSMGSTPDFKGVDIFIELLMFSTIVLLFIAHPITIVLGGIIGLGASFILLFLGTSSLTNIAGVIIYYLVAGGIIIWQISRRM